MCVLRNMYTGTLGWQSVNNSYIFTAFSNTAYAD